MVSSVPAAGSATADNRKGAYMLVGTVLALTVVGMAQDSVRPGRLAAEPARSAQVAASATTPLRGAGPAAATPGSGAPVAPASGPSPFAAVPSPRFAEDADARLPVVWRTPDGQSAGGADATARRRELR